MEAELLLVGSNFLYLGEFPCSWDVYPCCGSVISFSDCVLFLVGVIGTIQSTFSLAGREQQLPKPCWSIFLAAVCFLFAGGASLPFWLRVAIGGRVLHSLGRVVGWAHPRAHLFGQIVQAEFP